MLSLRNILAFFDLKLKFQKSLDLILGLYTILQILSVALFEKPPILQALSSTDYDEDEEDFRRQLILFD